MQYVNTLSVDDSRGFTNQQLLITPSSSGIRSSFSVGVLEENDLNGYVVSEVPTRWLPHRHDRPEQLSPGTPEGVLDETHGRIIQILDYKILRRAVPV